MSPAKARTGERGWPRGSRSPAAIALGVSLAKPGDTVLIAGKGHETYQEVNGTKSHFDDPRRPGRRSGSDHA